MILVAAPRREQCQGPTLIGEIVGASREQAQGIVQSNQAITQLDTVTQQNSAAAVVSAASAAEMNCQSGGMMAIARDLQTLVNGGGVGQHDRRDLAPGRLLIARTVLVYGGLLSTPCLGQWRLPCLSIVSRPPPSIFGGSTTY